MFRYNRIFFPGIQGCLDVFSHEDTQKHTHTHTHTCHGLKLNRAKRPNLLRIASSCVYTIHFYFTPSRRLHIRMIARGGQHDTVIHLTVQTNSGVSQTSPLGRKRNVPLARTYRISICASTQLKTQTPHKLQTKNI